MDRIMNGIVMVRVRHCIVHPHGIGKNDLAEGKVGAV